MTESTPGPADTNSSSTRPPVDAVHEAFTHFFHLDHANAAIHCADETRYSPITFRLAEALAALDPNYWGVGLNVRKVLDDKGRYPEDRGRA